MADHERRTAVGAGTQGGNDPDEEQETVSRASEAMDDDNLESLRTTGARVSGAPGAQVGQIEQPEKAAAAPSPTPGESGWEESVHPERPREHLKRNEAGIASRMDRVRGSRE